MIRSCLLVLFVFSVLACNQNGTSPLTGDAQVGADAQSQSDAGMCVTSTPTCIDQQIDQLDFFEAASSRTIMNETMSDRTISIIDATAGGRSATEAFVYARFTDTGLEPVRIGDQAALENTTWDIAFRRYVVRLNSGVGGPGCVRGARTAPQTAFADVARVPEGLTFRSEAYMSESCDIIPDGSGIGSPATVLSSYWMYSGCVKMSGNVYIVQLASGRRVKLQVLNFYTPAVQEQCDRDGTLPATSGAGEVRVQWAFLP